MNIVSGWWSDYIIISGARWKTLNMCGEWGKSVVLSTREVIGEETCKTIKMGSIWGEIFFFTSLGKKPY